MSEPVSHREFVDNITCDATAYMFTSRGALHFWVVRDAVRALGNFRLARETDAAEAVESAACPELARLLITHGACDGGMRNVGMHARDAYNLGELCAQQYRDDYMGWLADAAEESGAMQPIYDDACLGFEDEAGHMWDEQRD